MGLRRLQDVCKAFKVKVEIRQTHQKVPMEQIHVGSLSSIGGNSICVLATSQFITVEEYVQDEAGFQS